MESRSIIKIVDKNGDVSEVQVKEVWLEKVDNNQRPTAALGHEANPGGGLGHEANPGGGLGHEANPGGSAVSDNSLEQVELSLKFKTMLDQSSESTIESLLKSKEIIFKHG